MRDSVKRRVASNKLNFTTVFGSNYCEVDNTVKKLSFVFVSCSRKNLNDKKYNKIIEDSRKSITKEGILSNLYSGVVQDLSGLIPAYFIVFELDK